MRIIQTEVNLVILLTSWAATVVEPGQYKPKSDEVLTIIKAVQEVLIEWITRMEVKVWTAHAKVP